MVEPLPGFIQIQPDRAYRPVFKPHGLHGKGLVELNGQGEVVFRLRQDCSWLNSHYTFGPEMVLPWVTYSEFVQ